MELLLLRLSVFLLIYPALCQEEGRYTESIIKDIFSSYNKKIVPNAGTTTHVIMNMPLMMLIDVKENEHLAQFVVSDMKTWIDPRLRWDPSQYGNKTTIVVPEDDVWLPPTVIYNAIEIEVLMMDKVRNVKVDNTGRVFWNVPMSLTTTCRLKVDYFPFDTQTCTIFATSPVLRVEEMNAIAGRTNSVFGNAEWTQIGALIDVTTYEEFGDTKFDVRYHVKIRRNYVYYIIVIVLPTFLLSVLTVAGIFTAAGTTEIIGIGLTSLLALSVMLGIVAESLPKSNSLTLMGYYLLLCMFVASLSIIVAVVLSLVIEHFCRNASYYPHRAFYSLVCAKRRDSREKATQEMESSTEKSKISQENGQMFILCSMIREYIVLQTRVEGMKVREKEKIWMSKEWRRLFNRVEVLMVILFQGVNIAMLAVFFSFVYKNSIDPPLDPV
ncbi:hypothetical protein PRIPAC_91834 [Pristionchus pacificus]|uniref:Transmembrane ion channel n=1 Tax=Pristionchus pacificus TaxID=54126 RepID=A0A2A6BA55_PRIPA|nr:hypothetical protein PRIPAC_91834 [Pristionchus pacificus]|eukprot:PDM62765.1 transmembrane ion channel [Pristionchus pacificus]